MITWKVKENSFLSQSDELFINSFRVNIDTNDVNHTSYDQTPSENQIDLTTGKLKYVNENVQKSKEILDRQTESVKNAERYLDSKNHKECKEITPYLLNFHMKYKESVFELEEFDISTKYTLELFTRDSSKLSYKGKIQNTFDSSKYSFVKHLNGQSSLHFYHHRCELKLINNVTTSIRFFQDITHEKKDFSSRFCIHIVPEPRSFKHYNYFDFFYFFEFYQIHKQTYALTTGNAFHAFLTENETEIFKTFKKYSDINGPYKGIFDYRVYFLVHKNGQINTLKSPTRLNVYIPETFGKNLKRDNDKRYGLKAFYTEYNNLDANYWSLVVDSLRGTTQPLNRSLFPIRIITEGIVRKKKDFMLTDITGDERLLKLLPERSSITLY